MAADALTEAFLVEDAEGRFIWANESALAIMSGASGGLTPKIGDLLRPIFIDALDEHGNRIADQYALLQKVFASSSRIESPMRGLKIGDEIRWFKIRSAPSTDPTGAQFATHTFTEVTEWRHMADDLSDHERHLRTALEFAPIGMAILSPDGIFTEVNPAFCALVEREPDELIGVSVFAITHPDDCAVGDSAAGAAKLDGRPSYRIEKRYLTPSGRSVPVLVDVALVRHDDGSVGFIAQCTDIAARKQVERAQTEALRRERELVAELREVERLRADFVATASHELRTPVVSLLGYLDLMREEVEGAPIFGDVEPLLQAAVRNGQRLHALTDDLLAIAQIEATGFVLTKNDPVNVELLVHSAIEAVALAADSASVSLKPELGPDAGWIIGDATQLERMLVNLVGNAVKFSSAGDTVTIVVHQAPGIGESVTIEVIDTGPGIDPAEHDKLFERFYRSSSARDAAVAGTGLGLAIVKEVVERHQGTISLTSAIGEGATLAVTLPRTQRVPTKG